jgi:hypothetical protein
MLNTRLKANFKKIIALIFLVITSTFLNMSHAADCRQKLLPTSSVVWMGEFTNMEYSEEHQWGESIELWRSGECVFGIFISMAGLQGDPPRSAIKNGIFDSKTGRLSFNAVYKRVTVSSDPVSNLSKETVTENWFVVKGILTKRAFRGTVQKSSSEYPKIVSKGTLRLKRDDLSYHEDEKYVNYGQAKEGINNLFRTESDF